MTTPATDESATSSRLTISERAALGKAARTATPRADHARFEPSAQRSDPVKLLESQALTRVPELVPIRYGRMLVSPFTFYRGAAKIMAHDLASTPRTGLTVQSCGDAHLSNFGMFASPERRLVFDINDFDETLPGPWEWDVKRLVTSMLVAARDNGYRRRDQERIVLATVHEYRTAMRQFATMDNLSVWYAQFEVEPLINAVRDQLSAGMVKRTRRQLAKARTRDNMTAFAKLARPVAGSARIVDQSPLIVPIDVLAAGVSRDQLFGSLQAIVSAYVETLEVDRRTLVQQYELIDFARKVVGVGSVGTRSWIALLLGRDHRDPLFLQVKEAQASVLEDLLPRSQFDNHGQRVVSGQRLMQASSDILLGWLRVQSDDGEFARDFYVRQLRDWKGSAPIDQMVPHGMAAYGRACGWTLARAHARSGDRVAIAGYLGKGSQFDRALLEFADRYAEQNDRDYAALADAVATGRLEATTGL
jgi:uncharacterized protein (DUF2252 family)